MRSFKNPRRAGGFTQLEAILVTVILAVLISMFLPLLANPKRKFSRINCESNLKQISLAFRLWAEDHGGKYPMEVSVTNGGTMEWVGTGTVYVHYQVLSNELSTPKILFCPAESDPNRSCAIGFDPTFTGGGPGPMPFTNDNNVSYFVGVDTRPSDKGLMLTGDDNFAVDGKKRAHGLWRWEPNSAVAWTAERHKNFGNICFVDGSVRQARDVELGRICITSGASTNRLAMP